MGATTSTAIAQTEMQDMLEHIRRISSVDEILALVKKIDALKVALEAVDTFRQQSIKYAKMEADALIRVVELGGLGKLHGLHRKTAEWLYGLSETERERYILMCEGGMTIDNVYKREVGDAASLKLQIEKINQERDWLIEDCKETGIVNIKQFSDKVRDVFKFDKRSIGEDIIDGTRNRLKKAGAVGIGNDTGIYVMPCPENSEEIKKAILLRYESICNDFESIRKITRASGAKMSYKDFDSGANWSYHNNGYIAHLLIGLMRIGVISDERECYKAIENSDWHTERDYAEKQLRIARRDYIKSQYESLFGVASENSAPRSGV